ncbi:MAG: hypothetical protein KIS77_08960 [Saprospiraceae bacterium]|nr:hypothetical protein [Saprospiraceae bacterium]
MSCTDGIPYWHIIHQPDKSGMDCDLEQHFQLPPSNAYTLPNFPHFRLFDAHDSPCDTLGINGPPPPQCAGRIRVYPNPAQHLARSELPDCEGGSLRVFDAMGR